jgi:hypothetical protein
MSNDLAVFVDFILKGHFKPVLEIKECLKLNILLKSKVNSK